MAKILVIEENPKRAHAIKRMLDFALHETEVVPHGKAALDILKQGAFPEAIISNVIAAGIDGFRLSRTLKTNPQWAFIPLILIGEETSHPLDEELARRSGTVGLLRRPLQRDAFIALIDQVLLLGATQENALAKPNPQEEAAFMRDYMAWLTDMVYQSNRTLQNIGENLAIRDAHVYAMNTLTTALGDNLDLNTTAKTIATKAADILRAQAVAIYMYSDEHDLFILAYGAGFGIPTPNFPQAYPLDESSPLWRIAGRDRALLFAKPEEIAAFQASFQLAMPPASAIVSPLVAQGELNGFLTTFRADSTDPFLPQDADTLFSLAGAGGLALRSAQLFREIEIAYDNLKELDRRKSEFVAITSHELRTPIAIMLGYANLLREMEDDPRKKNQLATIEKQANFLTGMVEALLNLHELNDSGDPVKLRCSAIRMDELLQDALHVTQEHNTYRKEVTFSIDCDPIEIEGDEIRLMLAFNNLFDNAIKFSDPNKTVEVVVAEMPGSVIVTIEDHGIGIKEEYFEKIFEPFFQVEPAMTRHYGGLGLGLAISKGLIDLHNGSIEVKSKMREGSRFIVTLPAKMPPGRCQG